MWSYFTSAVICLQTHKSEPFRLRLVFMQFEKASPINHVVDKFHRTVQVFWRTQPQSRAVESTWSWGPAPAANSRRALWYVGAEGRRRERDRRGDSCRRIQQIYTQQDKLWLLLLLAKKGGKGSLPLTPTSNSSVDSRTEHWAEEETFTDTLVSWWKHSRTIPQLRLLFL